MDERLQAILNGGLEETTLPSGMHVRGVRPTVEELIRRRLMPSSLRKRLVATADKGEPESDADEEETAIVGLEYLDVAAAAYPQEYRFDARAAWRPLELPVEQFRKMSLDDQEHLRSFVRRVEEVADWDPFRGVEGGAPAGEDGGAVEDDAEQPAARPGRRRGVRAR